jgi:predicted aminopeptidase
MYRVEINEQCAASGWRVWTTFKTLPAALRAFERNTRREPVYGVRVIDERGRVHKLYGGR